MLRSLEVKAGVVGLRPRQLHVFDAPDRDDRGWVVSVAHLDAVRADRIPAHERATLVPVDELPPLKYDHDEIVRSAVAALRSDYRRWPTPPASCRTARSPSATFGCCTSRSSGERLVADTFRRTMLPHLRAVGRAAARSPRKARRAVPAFLATHGPRGRRQVMSSDSWKRTSHAGPAWYGIDYSDPGSASCSTTTRT